MLRTKAAKRVEEDNNILCFTFCLYAHTQCTRQVQHQEQKNIRIVLFKSMIINNI